MSFEEEDTCPSCSALDAAHAVHMLPAAGTCCLRLAAHNHLALCPIQNQRAARELMQVHEAAHASASKKESALKEQVDDLQHQLHQGTAT